VSDLVSVTWRHKFDHITPDGHCHRHSLLAFRLYPFAQVLVLLLRGSDG